MMSLSAIALFQAAILVLFALLERAIPARPHKKNKHFYAWLIGISLFGVFWLRVVLYIWLSIDYEGLIPIGSLPPLEQGLLFYIFYSFGNYWLHRWKHSNAWLWKYLHTYHHAPSHMETFVAFFRHPFEMLMNTAYLLLIGKLIFGATPVAVAIALAAEGCLETYHHANIRTPQKLRWLGFIFQIPEMHLVHHQIYLHRYNYGPFLWDTVFGTVKIPEYWDSRLGFPKRDNLTKLFLLTQPQKTSRRPRHSRTLHTLNS